MHRLLITVLILGVVHTGTKDVLANHIAVGTGTERKLQAGLSLVFARHKAQLRIEVSLHQQVLGPRYEEITVPQNPAESRPVVIGNSRSKGLGQESLKVQVVDENKVAVHPDDPVVVPLQRGLAVGEQDPQVGTLEEVPLEPEDAIVVALEPQVVPGLHVDGTQGVGTRPPGELGASDDGNGVTVGRETDAAAEKELEIPPLEPHTRPELKNSSTL